MGSKYPRLVGNVLLALSTVILINQADYRIISVSNCWREGRWSRWLLECISPEYGNGWQINCKYKSFTRLR